MAVNDRRYGLTAIYFIGNKITGKSVALVITGNVNSIILMSKTAINNICHKKLCLCIFQNVAFAVKNTRLKSRVFQTAYIFMLIF